MDRHAAHGRQQHPRLLLVAWLLLVLLASTLHAVPDRDCPEYLRRRYIICAFERDACCICLSM